MAEENQTGADGQQEPEQHSPAPKDVNNAKLRTFTQEEVDRIMRRMEAEEPVAQVKVKVGDKVRIVEGNFLDFTGIVDEVYPDKGKARVLVSFFNRETPVEVDLLQIERL